MNHTEWRLTDQEKAECRDKGLSLDGAQTAKKQAYLKAGGIILNPDALPALYEACKEALEASHNPTVEKILTEAINKAERDS